MTLEIKINCELRTAAATTLFFLAQVASAANPVGMNLAGVNYFSTNHPFLNIVKECGSNSPTVGWLTGNGGTDTGEQLLLSLDSDGYPLAIPQAGLKSTSVSCRVFNTSTNYLAPGQSAYYPSGSYTVQFSGAGTITISGDASATISSSGGTFTVSNPTNFGLWIAITGSTSGNHIRNLSVVQTSLVSSYNAGAIFHPTFLATIQNYSNLRFMDWKNTNGQLIYNFNALSAGATSETLASAWKYPSGAYTIYFDTNSNTAPASEVRSANFTAGSTVVTWTGGLTNSYYGYQAIDVSYSWAKRALPSNASYTLQDGVPIEVAIALCNTIGAGCHLNIPLTASDSYIENWGALVINGTGAQSGYSALNSDLTFYAELSNEVWNTSFNQFGAASNLGYQMWPTQPGASQYDYNRNWYGMRVAQMASDLQTQLGTSFSRCVPVLGAFVALTSSAAESLAATYWTTGSGPPSSYPIKAIAIAPYWGGNPSSTDATTMIGVTTPLDDFFATLTSQTGTSGNGSHVYSSVPSGGWLAETEAQITAYAAVMSSYPTMKLIAYEGGQTFYASSSGTAAGWPALITSAERDPRMGTGYTTMLNFWKNNVGGTSANINNLFNDINSINQYNTFGVLEDVLQAISPLTSAPPKYQAIQNYIGKTNIPMPPSNLVVH